MITTQDLHINVDYVLSNVIFVRVESKYVFIEKTAWHTIVRTFLKPEMRCSIVLRELKNIIFDLYHRKYILGEIINPVSASNRIMALIEPDLSSIPLNHSNSANVEFNEENHQYIERYVEPKSMDSLLDETDRDTFINTVQGYATVTEVIETEINYLSGSYDYIDALIRLVGFGKIRNLLLNYYIQDSLYVRSEYDKKLIKLLYNMGNKSIFIMLRQFKMKNYTQCPMCSCFKCKNHKDNFMNIQTCRFCSDKNICTKHTNYDELCLDCMCINTHTNDHNRFDRQLKSYKHENIVFFDERGFHGPTAPEKKTDFQIGKVNQIEYTENEVNTLGFHRKGQNLYNRNSTITAIKNEKTEEQQMIVEDAFNNQNQSNDMVLVDKGLDEMFSEREDQFDNFALSLNQLKLDNQIPSTSKIKQNSIDSGVSFFSFNQNNELPSNLFFKPK
jgi:hypothetical protein